MQLDGRSCRRRSFHFLPVGNRLESDLSQSPINSIATAAPGTFCPFAASRDFFCNWEVS
jgi:hypothetical protein